jgi:hypothetical protein
MLLFLGSCSYSVCVAWACHAIAAASDEWPGWSPLRGAPSDSPGPCKVTQFVMGTPNAMRLGCLQATVCYAYRLQVAGRRIPYFALRHAISVVGGQPAFRFIGAATPVRRTRHPWPWIAIRRSIPAIPVPICAGACARSAPRVRTDGAKSCLGGARTIRHVSPARPPIAPSQAVRESAGPILPQSIATALICAHTGAPSASPRCAAERRVTRASRMSRPTCNRTRAIAGW